MLVRPPASVNAACAAAPVPSRLTVPALLRLAACAALVAVRLILPISKLAPAPLVSAPPRTSELPPVPKVCCPSTLTAPVLFSAPVVVVKLAPFYSATVPELVRVPVRAAAAPEPESVHAPGLLIVTDPIVTAVVSVGSPVEMVTS